MSRYAWCEKCGNLLIADHSVTSLQVNEHAFCPGPCGPEEREHVKPECQLAFWRLATTRRLEALLEQEKELRRLRAGGCLMVGQVFLSVSLSRHTEEAIAKHREYLRT